MFNSKDPADKTGFNFYKSANSLELARLVEFLHKNSLDTYDKTKYSANVR